MNEASLSQLYLKDTAFQNLMQKRVFNVLLIASPYDAFMIEEDGRVEEQLFFEYAALNLSSPPRVTQARNYAAAMEKLAEKHFDLVIAIPNVDISETFVNAKIIKGLYPDVPFVVLTPFSREVSRRLANEDFSGVDYVFSWLGNVDLLLAIVKLLEDKLNADNDVNVVGVQMILLVEDSIRFLSTILPTLYKFLLRQSLIFSTEALNEHEQMMRMRGRPKIMVARDYEEAMQLYEKYQKNILGVVSDISFKHGGVKDQHAGLEFARELKRRDPFLPIIMESSEAANEAAAHEMGCAFINKNSKQLPTELGNALRKYFGFGDFIIRDPETGKEILRIKDLKDLQKHIFDIPDQSLLYHASYNDISRWLYSRAMFPIAEVVKMHRFKDISEAPAVRQLFFDLIVKYRKMKNRGVVAVFHKERFDHYSNFARIGEGSLGGKGRGLAFIDSIIKKSPQFDNLDGVGVSIPRTVVLCTDVFDEFMENNNLYPIALSDLPDEEILHAFIEAKLPQWLKDDFTALFEVVDKPLAIRSSSLLEDSHYQPFAGIYSTYMIPHFDDKDEMMRQLLAAVKSVYASVFYADSKAYMAATRNVIDQEKMAVIIQEVVGRQYGDIYYPSFAGVGRSLNYYPINDEQPEDGVAEVAVGLGILMFTQLNVQMMPKAGRDCFAVEIYLDGNASLKQTEAVSDSLQKILLKDKRYEPSVADTGTKVQDRQAKIPVLKGFAMIFSNIAFWVVLFYFASSSLPGWATKNWLPTLFSESLGISMSSAGPISTITIAVSSFIGVMIGGPVSDSWVKRNLRGRIWTSAIGLGLMIPALVLLGIGHSMAAAVAAGLCFGIGYGMFDTNNMPILCQFVPSRLRATAYGIMNMTGVFAGALCTEVLGKWADGGNLGFGFAVLAAVIAVALVIQLTVLKPVTDNME